MLMKATMNESRAKVRKSRLVFSFVGCCCCLALLGADADDDVGGFAWPLDVGRIVLDMELLVWV